MKKDYIKLTPIANGTVLDHLPVGSALRILEILGLGNFNSAVTIAINTESKSRGKKDLIFIEGKELNEKEIDKIGLIATGATLNIIKDSEVKKKQKIEMPDHANGLIQCMNPKCITSVEDLPTRFLIKKDPLKAKCAYCEKEMAEKEIFRAIK